MRQPFANASEILRVMIVIEIILGIAMIYLTSHYQRLLNDYVGDTEWRVLSGLLFNNYVLGFQLIITYLIGLAIWRRVWSSDYTRNIDLLLKVWMFLCFMVIFCGVVSVWSLFTSANALESTAELSLFKGVDLYYACPDWKMLWDSLQHQKQCCGVHSYKDWATATWMQTDMNLKCQNRKTILAPYACCRSNCLSCYETYIPRPEHKAMPYLKVSQINRNGCLPLFTKTMWRVLYGMSALMFIACKLAVLICCFVRYIINRQCACVFFVRNVSPPKHRKDHADKGNCSKVKTKRRPPKETRKCNRTKRCSCGAVYVCSLSDSSGSGKMAKRLECKSNKKRNNSNGCNMDKGCTPSKVSRAGTCSSSSREARCKAGSKKVKDCREKRKILDNLVKKISREEINALTKQNISQHTMDLLLKSGNELYIDAKALSELRGKIHPVLSTENQCILRTIIKSDGSSTTTVSTIRKKNRHKRFRKKCERQQQKRQRGRAKSATQQKRQSSSRSSLSPAASPPPPKPLPPPTPPRPPSSTTTTFGSKKSVDDEITEKLTKLIQNTDLENLNETKRIALREKLLPILLHGTPAQLESLAKQAKKKGFENLYHKAVEIVAAVKKAHGQEQAKRGYGNHFYNSGLHHQGHNPYCYFCYERVMH